MTIRTGEDLRRARQRLGLRVKELAERLRFDSGDAARHLMQMEGGSKPVTGPVAVAVELMLELEELREGAR